MINCGKGGSLGVNARAARHVKDAGRGLHLRHALEVREGLVDLGLSERAAYCFINIAHLHQSIGHH